MRGTIKTPDGKTYELPELTPEQLREIFSPYGTELGYLVASWNRLHDQLAQIFAVCFTPFEERKASLNSSYYRMAMAVWQSTTNDYSQRGMLRSLIKAPSTILTPGQADAIQTVLNEIDNSLRHKRNNAMHAPLMFTTGVIDEVIQTFVEPNVWTPNPQAKALRSSIAKRSAPPLEVGPNDLIEELKWYSSIADELGRYVGGIGANLDNPEHALPGKLKLPQPLPVKSRKA